MLLYPVSCDYFHTGNISKRGVLSEALFILILMLSDTSKGVNFVMGKILNSCPVGSIITSSPGRFVVPDNLFSQSINVVPSNTNEDAMSDGEEALNTFLALATRDSPLRRSYDRNVLMYPK